MYMNSNLTRRGAIQALAVAAAMASGTAMSQAWPGKPISLIVPFPAGGTSDVIARLVGEALGKELKTTVIVENRVGAGGAVAGEFAIEPLLLRRHGRQAADTGAEVRVGVVALGSG